MCSLSFLKWCSIGYSLGLYSGTSLGGTTQGILGGYPSGVLSVVMEKIRGGHNPSTRPRARPSSPGQGTQLPLVLLAPAYPTEPAAASQAAAPASPTVRRYDTRTGPVPADPPHPRLVRRLPPPKRARTSGLGESSQSQPQVPP